MSVSAVAEMNGSTPTASPTINVPSTLLLPAADSSCDAQQFKSCLLRTSLMLSAFVNSFSAQIKLCSETLCPKPLPCIQDYDQCGGVINAGGFSWNRSTTCCTPTVQCVGDQYYKQCDVKSPPPPRPPFPPGLAPCPSPSPPPLPPYAPNPPFPSKSGPYGGYQFMATTTAFGYAINTGCGVGVTRNVLDTTGFIPVAAAQAMMMPYAQECGYDGGCPNPSEVKCDEAEQACDLRDIPHCNQTGGCWCGKGTDAEPPQPGFTAPLGCLKCAYG
eukprot:4229753-Prymnesium_polylepis.1